MVKHDMTEVVCPLVSRGFAVAACNDHDLCVHGRLIAYMLRWTDVDGP